jgi:hypothetical protein
VSNIGPGLADPRVGVRYSEITRLRAIARALLNPGEEMVERVARSFCYGLGCPKSTCLTEKKCLQSKLNAMDAYAWRGAITSILEEKS